MTGEDVQTFARYRVPEGTDADVEYLKKKLVQLAESQQPSVTLVDKQHAQEYSKSLNKLSVASFHLDTVTVDSNLLWG